MPAERLQKILSAHGVASRRKAEMMIEAGRVTLNGKTAVLGQSATVGADEIAVDGSTLSLMPEHIYIMLNKPRGYVTTTGDERGRKTVMELVSGAGARVYPVGRLDMDSEGLLLMTNDGAFAERIAHPSGEKPKVYEVRARGDVRAAVPELRKTMKIDSRDVRASSVEVAERSGSEAVILVTIHEGRNRQIRKMCALCGLRVLSLKRVSIGALALGDLKPGCWRYLSDDEVRLI